VAPVNPTQMYCMLTAVDMERAVRFWTDTFGLKVKEQSEDWSELTFGQAIVALHGGDDEGPQPSGLGFDVDDMESACNAVIDAGGSLVWGPNEEADAGLLLAQLTDTEGNEFMFSSPYGNS
jgi:predicted enzyme related to lactoylglutathione lyase